YADGELAPALREQVEAWLSRHPEATAEVEQARRLTRLYRANPAPDPPAHAWDVALERIHAALPPVAVGPRGRLRWSWAMVGGLLSAAAVLAGVLVSRQALGPVADPPDRAGEVQGAVARAAPDEEPFLVAEAHEVNIISMDARDADKVVMGQPIMGEF